MALSRLLIGSQLVVEFEAKENLSSFEDMEPMTDWFTRAVLHVRDVEASLRFYVDRLGCTSPWRHEDDGRVHVAQVERQGCALILADTWPDKIGKGLMFISLNVERETQARRRVGRAARGTRGQGRFG